ncbi:hypothetical protein X801_06433, partial [Opisthorchis viverrini]
CNQTKLFGPSLPVTKWIAQHGLKFLGIPRYVSSGLFSPPGRAPCRFLIMDRFAGDLESALKTGKLKTVNVVRAASHVLDALEYLHSRNYAHADIKASNLLYNDSFEQTNQLSAFAREIDRLAYDETPNYRRLHQHLTAICKHTTSASGSRKVGPTGKRSSTESPSAVPNAQTDTSTKKTTPLASKRSRGRPVSTSKVCKDSTSTTRSISANAEGKSKPATV